MSYIPTTVPVIANFSTNGDIRPIYVRINGISLKVIQCVPHMNYVHPTFDCIVDDSGIAKNIRISYNPSCHVWMVVNC